MRRDARCDEDFRGDGVYACGVASVAQLGERQTEDLKVLGSIPGRGTLARRCNPSPVLRLIVLGSTCSMLRLEMVDGITCVSDMRIERVHDSRGVVRKL